MFEAFFFWPHENLGKGKKYGKRRGRGVEGRILPSPEFSPLQKAKNASNERKNVQKRFYAG